MSLSFTIKTTSSRTVYKNPWITVKEDKIVHPSGEKGIYGFVETLPTVGIVPMDGEGGVWLCQQYRYIFKDFSWEIPRGFVNPNESIIEAASRELEEESGLQSNEMIQLGGLRLSIGLLNEEAQVFFARNIQISHVKQDLSEIRSVKKFPLKQIHRMIKENTIKDGLTIGAIALVTEYLS